MGSVPGKQDRNNSLANSLAGNQHLSRQKMV